MTCLKLFMTMLVVTFIVDYSGFTQAWKDWLGRWLHIKVGSVKPFDCSLCMTHHICAIYAICLGEFNILVWAYICMLAALAKPTGMFMASIRYGVEGIIENINRLLDKMWRK